MTEDDTADDRQEENTTNTSRRTVLQGVAAGSAIGLGGIAAGQDGGETTTQQGDGGQQARFFEEGTSVGVQEVANGQLTAPTDFAQAREGDERYFVTDQTGAVYVVTQDGLRDEPFVDVSDRMVNLGEFAGNYATQGQAYDERGLLGIAFHPDFGNNRRFYLHYSAPRTDDMPDNWDHRELVSEFRASEDLSSANADSERVLLDIPHPQYNHNAGPIAFGPDGSLYVPMGDGGGANDNMYGHVDDWYDQNEGGNGQDVTENLLGSVLRIDVDAGSAETTQSDGGGTTTRQGGDQPYGIPDDNPFAGDSAGRGEIYAYGLRNPFGISFDSEGRAFTADLGQNLFEEVDVVEKGGNYGWNVKEGTHCFSTDNPSSPPEQCPSQEPNEGPYDGSSFVEPVAEYPHFYEGTTVGISIIGGHFYEQNTVSGLGGKYVFGDWSADAARNEPAGRLLAARPPEGDGGQTTQSGDATTEGGETTEEAALQDQETTQSGETTTGDGESSQVVPRDDLWEMRELVVRGSGDGATLNRFVRQFGQDNDGNIYVLVNTRGGKEAEWWTTQTGQVLQLVPPDQGEELAPPDLPEATATPADGGDGNATNDNSSST
jgi:glucose/arabinose dehydrogenase